MSIPHQYPLTAHKLSEFSEATWAPDALLMKSWGICLVHGFWKKAQLLWVWVQGPCDAENSFTRVFCNLFYYLPVPFSEMFLETLTGALICLEMFYYWPYLHDSYTHSVTFYEAVTSGLCRDPLTISGQWSFLLSI